LYVVTKKAIKLTAVIIITATCIRLKRLQWAGHVQRMEGTRIPKKVFKATFLRVRSVGNPGKDGKMRCNRMPPAFLTVATGSWPLMIENCGGRR
jgi:hypothetical protein